MSRFARVSFSLFMSLFCILLLLPSLPFVSNESLPVALALQHLPLPSGPQSSKKNSALAFRQPI
jgi:hypothetical protein